VYELDVPVSALRAPDEKKDVVADISGNGHGA
jgi:hypothetical protein